MTSKDKQTHTFSTEDIKIWKQITETVKPLKVNRKETVPAVKTNTEQKKEQYRYKDTNEKVPAQHKHEEEIRPNQTHKTDGNNFKKLKKGEYPIDITIDLHGMNKEQAYKKLENTIIESLHNQYRCIRVITGKGKGVLSGNVPRWLNTQKFRPCILAITHSPSHKGGEGVIYVLLRKV